MEYKPPPGPPPSYRRQPPPSGPSAEPAYLPPAGPPPSHEQFAPPPGPPPSYAGDKDSTINEDWKVIPDTALLPPPPSIGHDAGSTSNAELGEANRAHDWCKAHPMIRPHRPTQAQCRAVQNGDIRMMKPPEFKGDLMMPNTGTWRGSTRAGAPDSCLISSAPLYFALADFPSQTGRTKILYYEIEIRSLGRGRRGEECAIAIGFCAIPYPTWRMPGWERGSLAVHSDDGRRYVNDTYGGKDFTSPVKSGDTVGLGLIFSAPTDPHPPGYGAGSQEGISQNAEVFFTRNGQKDGAWNLHEELDAKADNGVGGLDGTYDLFAAVGVYGGTEFDIKFKRETWLWLPK